MLRGVFHRLAVGFLYAGSSAFLIALAHLGPEYRVLSLVCLVPFLWRAVRVRWTEAILLGVLLAVSYGATMGPQADSIRQLITGTATLAALLALYGLGVNRLAGYVGVNAVLIAFLWLPVDYGLRHLWWSSQDALPVPDTPLASHLATLFGALFLTWLIVLVNGFIAILLEGVQQALSNGHWETAVKAARVLRPTPAYNPTDSIYYPGSPRSPPRAAPT